MFNILSHQGNTNQNNLRFHLPPVRMAKIKKKPRETAGAGEIVEKKAHSSIAGGIASCYNHSGNQFGGSTENWA